MDTTRTYKQFTALTPPRSRIRDVVRAAALRVLATGRRIDSSSNWIRFPYYHHVFEDERAGFTRQLGYLANFGDFISIDDAVDLLDSGTPIDGRYFCVTFDDGLASCAWGAAPILTELHVPAVFYVVTDMVGRSLNPDSADARATFGFKGNGTSLDFMTWDELHALAAAGFTIGSHTAAHARLATLDADAARVQLATSKATIEENLNLPCRHFCPPYGIPGVDFVAGRDGALAREVGYRSLTSGSRGPNRAGDSPYFIRRDHLLANWGLHQVRYFLSMD